MDTGTEIDQWGILDEHVMVVLSHPVYAVLLLARIDLRFRMVGKDVQIVLAIFVELHTQIFRGVHAELYGAFVNVLRTDFLRQRAYYYLHLTGRQGVVTQVLHSDHNRAPHVKLGKRRFLHLVHVYITAQCLQTEPFASFRFTYRHLIVVHLLDTVFHRVVINLYCRTRCCLGVYLYATT